MARFRDWDQEQIPEDDYTRFKKKDDKRYDKKKRAIQKARKNKRKIKNGWLNS